MDDDATAFALCLYFWRQLSRFEAAYSLHPSADFREPPQGDRSTEDEQAGNPLASRDARSRDRNPTISRPSSVIARPAFAQYRAMRAIEPPGSLPRASAHKREGLTRAIESDDLRVIRATALPRAGKGAPFKARTAVGRPLGHCRLACVGGGVRGTRHEV